METVSTSLNRNDYKLFSFNLKNLYKLVYREEWDFIAPLLTFHEPITQ